MNVCDVLIRWEMKDSNYTLVEKYDPTSIKKLLLELPDGHHDRPFLQQIIEESVDGRLTTKYKHSDTMIDSGRVYAGRGYQILSRNTRNRLLVEISNQ